MRIRNASVATAPEGRKADGLEVIYTEVRVAAHSWITIELIR
jgi:hypothetical protein